MRKLLFLFVFAVLIPLQSQAVELWKEGTHYTIIGDEVTEKPEIIEFFSYWCGHCYNFEPIVKELENKLRAEKAKTGHDVKFKKVHVNFMGFTSAEVQDQATKALMIARAMNVEKAMNGAIFKYIHVQRAPITGLDDLRNIFTVNGVDGAQFDKMSKSFGINSQLKANNKVIKNYMKHLRGVPNFIVNGKYQAKFTREMSPDDMVQLIVWLSKLK